MVDKQKYAGGQNIPVELIALTRSDANALSVGNLGQQLPQIHQVVIKPQQGYKGRRKLVQQESVALQGELLRQLEGFLVRPIPPHPLEGAEARSLWVLMTGSFGVGLSGRGIRRSPHDLPRVKQW